MFELKDYQKRVRNSLRDFLAACGRGLPPAEAFHAVAAENVSPYYEYQTVRVAKLSPQLPYVCLRVPTGGGKTLLACYGVGLAKDHLLQAEHAVAVWLVPSNTILKQTADALRSPTHPYREALNEVCRGEVEVVTIEEALRLPRGTVETKTVVIVSTIQAFRVEDTTGRKVYAENAFFADHLANAPEALLTELLAGPDGNPTPSLVNMLRLRRPIVIVDEAHNARTYRSFNMLADLNPSCVIELTATPSTGADEVIDGKRETVPPSNVLHRVRASELKSEKMVKLPLKVMTRHPSQKDILLAEAISLRADLERLCSLEAQATGEYLRPIMLIQAERVDACEPLRARLAEEYQLPIKQIVISTGVKEELKDIPDISAPDCPVRFILTVEKLREGWDCPFAYVLCSLKETRSPAAIEQIVGRILRLPNTREKQNPALNCSYAFSVSENMSEVLSELRGALERNGFTPAEADHVLNPVPQGSLPLGVQPATATLDLPTELDVALAVREIENLNGKARIEQGTGTITIFTPLTDAESERLEGCALTPCAKQKIQDAVRRVREVERAFGGTGAGRPLSPHQQRKEFTIPLLGVHEYGRVSEFGKTHLIDHPWRLGEKDATLGGTYNPLKRPEGTRSALDIGAAGSIVIDPQTAGPENYVEQLHQQVMQLAGEEDWTAESLVAWLDSQISHDDITVDESAVFLLKAVNGLMSNYGIRDVGVLARDRYRLRDGLEELVEKYREQEKSARFTQWLLPDAALTVDPNLVLDCRTMEYEPGWYYEGAFQFKKHYFGPNPGELAEKRKDGKLTEEFDCALHLDQLPEVEYWFRNLAKRPSSFRLLTSKDWFYPDFVCKLVDGRTLVVEYKGDHLFESAVSCEKRAVGAVWEKRSGNLFIMPKGHDLKAITDKIKGSG